MKNTYLSFDDALHKAIRISCVQRDITLTQFFTEAATHYLDFLALLKTAEFRDRIATASEAEIQKIMAFLGEAPPEEVPVEKAVSTDATVDEILTEAGIDLHAGNPFTTAEELPFSVLEREPFILAAIRRLGKQGFSVAELADELGQPISSVTGFLRGLQTRKIVCTSPSPLGEVKNGKRASVIWRLTT